MTHTIFPRGILTPGDVQRLTGWSRQKVSSMIRSGLLPARNTSPGKRPTYVILPEALEAIVAPLGFQVLAKDQPSKATRKKRIDADVPKVFGVAK